MIRGEDHVAGYRWIRRFVIACIWLTTALLMAPFTFLALPDIEAALLPVLRDQVVSDVRFTNECKNLNWKWSFTKARSGVPAFVSFMAFRKSRPRDRYPVAAMVDAQCDKSFNSANSARVGEVPAKEMCVELPVQLQCEPDVIVEGYFEYRVAHNLYTVPQHVPASPDGWPDVETGLTSTP